MMEERQKTFAEAFDEELNQYKATGSIPSSYILLNSRIHKIYYFYSEKKNIYISF